MTDWKDLIKNLPQHLEKRLTAMNAVQVALRDAERVHWRPNDHAQYCVEELRQLTERVTELLEAGWQFPDGEWPQIAEGCLVMLYGNLVEQLLKLEQKE